MGLVTLQSSESLTIVKGVVRLAIKNLGFMAKKTKQSQVDSVKTKLLCMDAEVQAEKVFGIGDTINAKVEYVDVDNLRITQHPRRDRTPQESLPERRFKDLTGSLHGKISKTDFGVTLHVYVRHGEYVNACALADIFESETEQMCDALSEMTLADQKTHA